MEVDHRRTPQGNYMVLSAPGEDPVDRYSLQMILKNRISGLLKTEAETLNGQLRLLYEITSLRSLTVLMEKEKIKQEWFRALISDMACCEDGLHEYLLDIRQIIFQPEYIYLDQENSRFFFCFHPCYKGDHQSDIRELFDRILGSIEYEDPDYVKLVYELHMAVQKDNFRISDLSEIMSRTDESETVNVRGMFEEELEGSFDIPIPGSASGKILKVEEEKDLCTYHPASGNERDFPGFFDKLKSYLKGKTLKDVIYDIDNGVFLQKVNTSFRKTEMPAEVKKPERKGKDKAAGRYTTILRSEKGTPCLVGIGKQKGDVIHICKYPFCIGKLDEETDCIIDVPTVSRMHARIRKDPSALPEGYLIEDLNSTNGTYINGMRIEPYKKEPIRMGDVIRIADLEYILKKENKPDK